MKENYSIEIQDSKAATYKAVTFIIALINLLAFSFFLFYTNETWITNTIGIGFICSLLAVFFFIVKKFSHYLSNLPIEILFIICAIILLITGNYLPGLLLMVLTLLSFVTSKKLVIKFSIEGIRYPSFPVKLFPWSAVDFVLLKDDILTLEMKNNRLLQFTLEKHIADAIETNEFNAFCAAQLANK